MVLSVYAMDQAISGLDLLLHRADLDCYSLASWLRDTNTVAAEYQPSFVYPILTLSVWLGCRIK